MKKKWAAAGGALAGIVNGLLGAAGGMVLVPMLRKGQLETKKSHANSVAIILPISLVSAFFYLQSSRFSLGDSLPYLPGGILGAIIGAWLLPRIPSHLLRRVFGIFMLWAAIRLFGL